MKAEILIKNRIGKATLVVNENSYTENIDTKLTKRTTENEGYPSSFHDKLERLFNHVKNQMKKDLDTWKRRKKEPEHSIYYDLLKLTYNDGFSCHIPLPVLYRRLGVSLYSLIIQLAIETETLERGRIYYECPVCGKQKFYQGICTSCKTAVSLNEDREIPEEYETYQEEKQERKEQFFKELQHTPWSKKARIKQVLEDIDLDKLSYVESIKTR